MHFNGKNLKCHLKGKASKKLANGQNIDYSEKRKWPKGFICPCTGVGFICPCTGVKYHNIQTCLLVYAADSGERLQDHWSSGTIYGRGVHLGHVTRISLSNFRSPCPWMLHIKFQFDRPSGFREEDFEIVDGLIGIL